MRRSFNKKRLQGFTLVEVLAAVAIATLIILVVGATFYYTVTLHGESTHRAIAINDAVRIIEQCRYIADTNGLTGPGSVTDSGVDWASWLSGLLPNETVDLVWSGTNPLEVTFTVGWAERNRLLSVSTTTLVTRR